MSRKRRKVEIVVGDDGRLVDVGRLREIEALGRSMTARTHQVRDEMLRRALIIAGDLPMETSIADIKAMGKAGLAARGVELVYHRHPDPERRVVAVYALDASGRRARPVFWIATPIAITDPGGHVQWERGPDDYPVIRTSFRYGGDQATLRWMREKNWPDIWPELRCEEVEDV